MPNHIKNKLEIIGTEEQVKQFFERFSTHYPRDLDRAHDGSIICKRIGSTEKWPDIGWYNEETKKFSRRGEPDVEGLPEGWEYTYEEAWDRFPDFEKVIPMPEGLHIESGSTGEMGLFILTGKKTNTLMSNAEMHKRFTELSQEQQEEALKVGRIYAENIKNCGHATWYSWSIANWGTKWNSYECQKLTDNIYVFDTAWSSVLGIIDKMSREFPEIMLHYTWADEDTGYNCGRAILKNGLQSQIVPEGGSKDAYDIAFELRPHYKENYELIDGKYKYKEDEE